MTISTVRGLLAAACLLVLTAGCERTPTQQPPLSEVAQAEAADLVGQLKELQAQVGAAGTMTSEALEEMERLAIGFEDWGARHGRDDIRVLRPPPAEVSTPLVDAAAPIPAITRPGPAEECDHWCSAMEFRPGQICFLAGVICAGPVNVCQYICFYTGEMAP